MQVDTRAAEGIYGRVLVMTVLAVASHTTQSAGHVLIACVGTAFVFGVAHVYADVLAARVLEHALPLREDIRGAARAQWPLVEAVALPAIPLALGIFGVLSRDNSITLALWVGVADLFAWGVALARALKLSLLPTVLIGLGNVALGVAIIGLKVFVH